MATGQERISLLGENFPEEFAYIEREETQLREQYSNQYVVVNGDRVVAAYGVMDEVLEAMKQRELVLPSVVCRLEEPDGYSFIHLLEPAPEEMPIQDILEEAAKLDLGDIEEQLRNHARPRLTDEEYRAQKISFFYGELNPRYGITRAEAEEVADRCR